jgi:hypothetical protein
MIDYGEQKLFEATKAYIADVLATMIDEGPHPDLTFAAVMLVISEAITTEGYWGDDRPDFMAFHGFWNLMRRLQEKAFADLSADQPAPPLAPTI